MRGILTVFVLIFAASLCAYRVLNMARDWRRGRSVSLNLWGGLRELPSRYLHDVHDVVAGKPRNARMHALLAGGVLGSLIFLVLCLIVPRQVVLATLAIACCMAAVFGIVTNVARRRSDDAGLSTGRYSRLHVLFAGVVFFVSASVAAQFLPSHVGMGLSVLAGLAGTLSLGSLAWMAGDGPMRHAFAGTANLVMHPRPERFGGRSTALRTIDLDSADLGTQRIEEFSVPQLASFDACVQCGRCEQVCPAYAAGQPLNPKRFINDLAATMHGGRLHYAGAPHPGQSEPFVPGASLLISRDGTVGIDPETIWSCTTCRACVDSCPMMIEHVDAMIDIRRSLVMNDGTVPVNAQATLESLRETDTQRGVETSFRFDWAADLRLPEAKPGERAEHILWVGESAFDLMAQRTLRSLVRLMREGGLDPHVLGAAELDCGDVARRMGDEETFQSLATRNIATLSQLDFGTIITADPHAMQVLKNEYRELGGNFSVLHHTELLAQLLDEQRIVPKVKLECSVTYHDPCYLGRYNDVFSAPRQILSAIGADLKEMDRSGRRSHCCGGGGAAPLLDIPGERRIPDMRMRQIEDTGAECVAVACPGCAVMLEGVADKKANVRDVAEMLLDCVEGRS